MTKQYLQFKKIEKFWHGSGLFYFFIYLILFILGPNQLFSQDKPIKLDVEIDGQFNIDSALVQTLDNYRIYGNEYDKSDYYFQLNDKVKLTTIGWFWLKLISNDNLTLDTLANPKNQKIIRGIYPINNSMISVSTNGGSFLVEIENRKFINGSLIHFEPLKRDKKFRRNYHWLSFLTEKDTVVAIRQSGGKTSQWKLLHYNNGQPKEFFNTCEISSQYPFELGNKSVKLTNEQFSAPFNECGVYLIYSFKNSKTKFLQYPPLDEHYSIRRIYYDQGQSQYYAISEYRKERSLYEIQNVKIEGERFVLEDNSETLLLQDLYEIIGVESGNIHVRSTGLKETIHYMIPFEKLSNIEIEIERLKEVQVEKRE